MITTTYTVRGLSSSAGARAVKDQISWLPDVGGVAVELMPDQRSKLILKHKDDVEIDREAVVAAVERAGRFTVS